MLAVALLDVVILAAIYVAVTRDELRRERTATDELWSRGLSYYQTKAGHGVTTVTRERSSLRDCAASALNSTSAAGK